MGRSVTCIAPVNIAVIKYWGKRDSKLNLPINSSLSGTLDMEDLKTVTTVSFLEPGQADQIELNGKQEDINNPRIQAVLKEMRSRAQESEQNLPIAIRSSNNFPTAAGLASSASGYAAMVFGLSKLFRIDGEVSDVARQGSGSSTRSLFGGFVRWEMGQLDDGKDSIASQVVDENHWADMRVLILVVSDHKKSVSSAAGMQQTVKTCPEIPDRIKRVPERMIEMERAIQEKDFEAFAKLTMVDSDDFHNLCHTTQPPIHYMNDVSFNIVKLVQQFNQPSMRAAYTFDAGPNAVIYLPESNVQSFLSTVMHYFPPKTTEGYVNNPQLIQDCSSVQPEDVSGVEIMSDALQRIIYTKIGPGPSVIQEE